MLCWWARCAHYDVMHTCFLPFACVPGMHLPAQCTRNSAVVELLLLAALLRFSAHTSSNATFGNINMNYMVRYACTACVLCMKQRLCCNRANLFYCYCQQQLYVCKCISQADAVTCYCAVSNAVLISYFLGSLRNQAAASAVIQSPTSQGCEPLLAISSWDRAQQPLLTD